jgi:nicotinate-nucleotide pyrophosphorylase (carboxylating)
VNWLLVDGIVRRALLEDIGHGDITTELLRKRQGACTARFKAKAPGVLCGGRIAARCFTLLDANAEVQMDLQDGSGLSPGDVPGTVSATASTILTAERVALNFLQRLSGIATQTRLLADQAREHGIQVVETRKTTPGLRTLEKYAVRVGGGSNHRMDLDHCVMLKDNHFALAKDDPEQVVRAVRAHTSHTMKVIAEASGIEMVEPLLCGGADVVLLDNFTPEEVREAVQLVQGRAIIEVSGRVDHSTISNYLIDGVDVISIGALTHSYHALDISLEV